MPNEILELIKKDRLSMKELFRNWDKNNSQKISK